jgi:hypothetical protein
MSMDAPESEMRDETLAALKAWRTSRALALDEQKFRLVLADIRENTDTALWSVIAPRKPAAKKQSDPLLLEVKGALAKYKAAAAAKAERLIRYMLPDRATMPKSIPASVKILRAHFSDTEIAEGARALMRRLEEETGTDVPL